MKNYIKGIFILGISIIGILYIGIKFYQSLIRAKSVFIQVRKENENNKKTYELIQKGLLTNSPSMKTINNFSKSWETFLNNSNDSNVILSNIVQLSFKNSVVVSEKFAQRQKLPNNDILKESILINLKVVGKFERIYEWLGEVEKAYPQAKINNLELMTENMNAALILGIEIPILT